MSVTGEDLTFCRNITFYVDSTSSQILELGTFDYPFKDIYTPFIELWKYHRNPDLQYQILV